ncbi:N-acetylmuramoyl-L-alanine amidase [Lysinibacillus sp. LZ02]|uniref:N-acetylmuramoyl-L-alanine amidase n=1 Tax=Lysinibacillus sp. LZ02 TaxID=3420668 RepID=UPI003D365B43
MRKTVQLLIALVLIVSISMPKLSNAASDDLIVTGKILNLREGPGLSYPILDELKEGDTLSTIEKSGDWIHVKSGNTEGWVASWLTKPLTEKESAETSKIIISQVDHLNVRAEPSLSAAVLAQLFLGNEANYIKSENDWIQIQFGTVTGWVSSQYITIKDRSIENNQSPVASTAKGNLFTVTVDAVNVRKKADLTSKRIGVAYNGEQFTVLDQAKNWVQIQYADKTKGWIYSFYGTFSTNGNTAAPSNGQASDESVTIIYDGTNLREEASTASAIVHLGNVGETYPILSTEGDWYKIALKDGQVAFVANWVVSLNNATQHVSSTQKNSSSRKKGTLRGLTIVIDPGHGGNDHGTTGVRGTDEKDITLKTAELLKSKLRAAGADVVLTRESDVYVDLRKRVAMGHQVEADAFISIHYDATENSSVSGVTTYYMNSYQKQLAEYVHAGLSKKVSIRDRGVQPGNYLVLRENRQEAILIELGFLSNPSEERNITTDYYREQATLGIYQGILNYFDAQL